MISYEGTTDDTRPILIVPYMWIGDFVRGHTVVRVLKQRWPNRPVDLLTTSLCAPLVDYMPGVRAGIVWDLPRSRLALARQWRAWRQQLRERPLRHRAGAAPDLEIGDRAGAGRHSRTGRLRRRGQVRAAQPLALGREGPAPLYRQECRAGAAGRRAIAAGMAGAAAPRPRRGNRPLAAGQRARRQSRPWRWRRARSAPPSAGPIIAEAARLLAQQGLDVWVVGGPGEKALAAEIVAAGGPRVRDLTGTDLRNGILAMAAADVAISNDSGLMHIAAAIGTPTMGIFGPTSPYHWAPLNGLAATVQTKTMVPCQPCHRPVCTMNDHRCMRDIPASDVAAIAERVLAEAGARAAH